MTFDFRYPQITGATEKEQLVQMRSYMHQLVDQLKWALNSVETPQSNYVVVQQKVNSNSGGTSTIGLDDDSTQARFNELKPLIIKSAEIVNAYYEEINKRLESLYVAQSDFGAFVEQNSQEIEATATDITQRFENVQVIISDIDSNVGSLSETLVNISEEVSYTQRDIGTINSNIEAIGGSVADIASSVSVFDGEIKAVAETVGAIDSELQAVGTNLQDTKVGIDSTIEQLSDEVGVIDSDLQGVKAGVESNIKDLSNEIGNVDSKIEDAKSAIGSDLEQLKKSLDELNSTIVDVKARIKSGLLYYDGEIPVYGLEIGQENTINGVKVFNQFARFCAGKLSFYDQNGTEVAYISDYKLYITHAEVTGTLKLGGYLVDTSNGVTFKWVGRS